ncbi:hypothetical protein [Moorella sulfitireducens (nom. illeg.)]|uniref:hypothetical protein n=1 Tax=Neomoorella sulfitireducens TaxID=2972948 RepID=UPI0021AC22BB|nr:hypothetical protein [Moorella sulfitireducens]
MPNKQWHPVFVTALKEALVDAPPGQVEIQAEVALSSRPLDVDVIIIKKKADIALNHPVARVFRRYNLFEFKSPVDYLEANDFDKGLALVRLYKVIEHPEALLLDDFTLTLVSSSHPRAMMEMLNARQLKVQAGVPAAGIYQVKGEMFVVQVVVINELEDPEVLYPFAPFITGQRRKETQATVLLLKKFLQDPSNPYRKDLAEFTIENELVLPEEMEEVQQIMYSPEERQRMKEIFNKSPIMQEWLKEWSEQAKIEGLAKGRAEGAREGKIEKAQDAICTYLKIKYAPLAPEWLAKVREINNLELLDAMLVRLFQAATKEEAQAVIAQALEKANVSSST